MSIPFDAALKQSAASGALPNELAAQEPVSELNKKLDSALGGETRKADASRPSFCDEIAPQATRYAMSIVRCWGDAEEIVQEAFCRLLDSKHFETSGFNDLEAGTNKALLFTTIRNLSIDQLRKNKTRRFETVDTSLIADSKQNDDGKQLQQLEASLEASLKTIPDQWSDALKLKVNGGLSYEEISKVMNVTHAQVRTWIFRARKQLQADLKKQGLLQLNEDD